MAYLYSHYIVTGGVVGWCDGPGLDPVPGRPTIWIIVGQGPTALAVGAGGGCLDIFSLVYHFSFLTPSLWETARYRLKYCLKWPLSPNQPTNQHILTAWLLAVIFTISLLFALARIASITVLILQTSTLDPK